MNVHTKYKNTKSLDEFKFKKKTWNVISVFLGYARNMYKTLGYI